MNASPLIAVGFLSALASGQQWQVAPLVLEGDTVFGGHAVLRVNNVAINNNMDWRAEVTTANGLGPDTMVGPNGAVAQESMPLLFPNGATLRSFDSIQLNSAGHMSMNVFLNNTSGTGDDSAVYYDLTMLVQEGQFVQAEPFDPLTYYRTFYDTKIDDNGNVLLLCAVDDPTILSTVDYAVMYLQTDTFGDLVSELVIAMEGDPVGQTGGLITILRTGPHSYDLSDKGSIVFSADTDLPTTMDGVVILNDEIIAQEGTPSPVEGRNWSVLSSAEVSINNSDDWVVSATINGSSSSNLLIARNGQKFVQEGDPVPGIPQYTLTTFGSGPVDIADTGEVLWYGDWNDPNTQVDTGLFVDDQLIVQEGVSMVDGVIIDTLIGATDGYAFSDDGRFVIFEAILQNGVDGAFVATCKGQVTSIPGCNPDGSSLTVVGGSPSLGETLELRLNSPSPATGLRFLAIAGVHVVDGSGCGVDLPGIGEVLIGFTPPNPFTLPAGTHTGGPGLISLEIPNNPALVGMPRFLQAYYLFPSDPTNLFDLTNALEVTLGA